MRHFAYTLLTLVILGAAPVLAGPADDEASRRFIAEVDWSQIEDLPVMNYDLVVSLRSLAEDRVEAITRSSRYGGQPSVFTYLSLVYEMDQWRDEKLFKLRHRVLRDIYETRHVSLNTLSDESNMDRVDAWVGRLAPHSPDSHGDPDLAVQRRRIDARRDIFNRETRPAVMLLNVAASFAVIPQEKLTGEITGWLAPAELEELGLSETYSAIAAAYEEAAEAFRSRDAQAFVAAFGQMRERIQEQPEWAHVPLRRVALDVQTSRLDPFFLVIWLYLATAVLFALLFMARFRPSRSLWGLALALMAGAFALHAWGIVARALVTDQTPLTNFYESLVFATAGLVALALVLEAFSRRLYCGLGGALMGAVFSMIANSLSIHMARPKPTVAALQSFWLHLHVSTIMLSYSAFALSLFICLAYFFLYFMRRIRTRPAAGSGGDDPGATTLRHLERLNFNVILIGFPLLTIGIILGAAWANTAWGRPWGWDPKETASAVTWVAYALYFHLRQIVRPSQPVIMLIALLGFVGVLITYVVVSFFLPGLHSYA